MTKNKAAKQLAEAEGISYAAALRRVREQYEDDRKRELQADLESLFPSLESLLPAAVAGWCKGMTGDSVARHLGQNWIAGLTFDDVELPTDILHEIVVDRAEPDLGTISWDQHDVFPDGDEVGMVEVEADVTFTGWGRPDAIAGRQGLRLVDPDVDGDAEVTFSHRVRLHWHVVYRPGVDYLDLTYAYASELVPLHPHA
ncbi:hypothetical protein [Verrucosispora sp. WMMD1129]|uniref:hypothetical protein n=1 Tax=Verrucosispora sp. WMMD1129 TaxID=3016093 RepID=UPI00249C3D83|nr:hypothetical protein [Verrucosispora sp. WMMD1129]WFE47578.1 hypothetical protein O7624_26285 [Verrucosispora sp. WMMD1129]